MNPYEAKQQARKERLEAAAEKAKAEQASRFKRAREATAGIPFGQPILVGHHSEKRHRAALKRSDDNMRAGVEAGKRAADLQQRAASVGQGGISSDDPDALPKLREKLGGLEADQERMKQANTIFRKGGINALAEFDAGFARDFLKLKAICPYESRPFPAYALSNNNANIHRVRERIAQLEREAERADQPPAMVEAAGFTITEDPEDNRVLLTFPGIPPKPVRELLHSRGWKWSRSRGAWVRMLNDAGRRSVRELRPGLESMLAGVGE